MFTEEQMKQYDEQVNKTRERLMLASECFHPFDYGYCLELVKIVIDSWKEYYTSEINVWGEDREDCPSRKEMRKNCSVYIMIMKIVNMAQKIKS